MICIKMQSFLQLISSVVKYLSSIRYRQPPTRPPPNSPFFSAFFSRILHTFFSSFFALFLSPSPLTIIPTKLCNIQKLKSPTMVLLVYFVLFLALTGHSSALYCVCKDGVGDQVLQKALDYACGAGADCTAIMQNGACYNPNTVKDHCSYAVNSYFQKKGQAQGSCDFSGAATTSQTAPASSSGCAYPSSGSSSSPGTGSITSTTPTTSPTTGITGTTPSTPTSTTPTSTTTGTTTGTGTGTSSSSSTPMFGISPTASTTTGTGSTGFNDSSKGLPLLQSSTVLTLQLAFLVFWLMYIIRV